MQKTEKKYTLVTGASSGIGYATAKAFAKRGKNLIIAARRKSNLEKLRDDISKDDPSLDIVVKATDLSVNENVHKLYRESTEYDIETWINDAGFGNYGTVAQQNQEKIERMLRLNVEALAILSSLYVRDYRDVEGTRLINISSAGGYTIVPTAVAYCASKFFVSAFTEGLARELLDTGAAMRAKVLAPAATMTGFGNAANDTETYDYDKAFGTYHTSDQMAGFLLRLYDSDKTVGEVNRETFEFRLTDPKLPYAGGSGHNQRITEP